jgi:hypothetical protein
MFVKDWGKYKNFNEAEFRCSHSNQAYMTIEFMEKLQAMRTELGRPMKINSGYRSPEHPIEKAKDRRGEHTYGCAADIQCSPGEAIEIVGLAIKHGFTRIGINQKGPYAGRFIHVGLGYDDLFPRNVMWSY